MQCRLGRWTGPHTETGGTASAAQKRNSLKHKQHWRLEFVRQYVELWLKSGAGTSCSYQLQEIASNGKSQGAKGHKHPLRSHRTEASTTRLETLSEEFGRKVVQSTRGYKLQLSTARNSIKGQEQGHKQHNQISLLRGKQKRKEKTTHFGVNLMRSHTGLRGKYH